MQARFKDIYFTIYTYIKKTDVSLYPKVSAYTGSSVVAYPKSTYVATGGSSSSGANTSLSNLTATAINAALLLGTDDGFALGSSAKRWSDLFLAEGGVINWDNGDMTLTQSGNTLTVAGGVISNPGAGTSSEIFGSGATAAGQNGSAFGNGATSSGTNSGAFGQSAVASASNALAFGPAANASAAQGTALGVLSTASGINATVVGEASTASANFSITIGHSSTSSHQNSFIVGEAAASTATNQIVFGSSAVPYTNLYLGGGVSMASPSAFTINSTGGSGTNNAGADLNISAGIATGNAAGGNILFKTSTVGSSGTAAQSLATRLTITPTSVTSAVRNQFAQGADVASANNLSLGTDGNAFEITGTTTINLISSIGWQNGAVIRLVFSSSLTVTNNAGTSGTNINILLAGGANFSATANDCLTLMLCEIGSVQNWVEVSRSVN